MSIQLWGLIFVVWGLIMLFAVALCRAAARADQQAERMSRETQEWEAKK
jgi:hypothetical protein